MARKTNGEKIDELEKLVSTLTERMDNVRQEKAEKVQLAVIEERLNELKRTIEEASRRHWLLWPSIIGAGIGAVLGFIGQLIIFNLK